MRFDFYISEVAKTEDIEQLDITEESKICSTDTMASLWLWGAESNKADGMGDQNDCRR